MRRLLLSLLTAVLVVGSGILEAPSASAQAVLPPGQYLWATTTTQTVVYDRSTVPPTLAATPIDNNPTGNLVRDPTNDIIYVATAGGIDAIQGSTGVLIFGMGDHTYQQVVVTPDGTKVYGLRAGGEVIDVFSGGGQGTLITSIELQGQATGMSDPRPPAGDVIVIGSIFNESAGNYDSAYITTADDNLVFFNLATQQKVNGSVWSPDGSVAYLATESLNSPATPGSIGVYEPLTGLTQFPLASGVTPLQLAISPDGGQLLVPADDAGLPSIQLIDTATMSTTGSVSLGASTWGFPAVSPDNKAYFPPGPDGAPGVVLFYDLRGGFAALDIGTDPVIGVLVADRPAAVQATSGAGQRMYVNRVFDAPLVATVVDPAGNALPGHYVTFEIQSNSPVPPRFVPGVPIFNGLTGPDGTVTTPLIVAGETPGTFTVLASVVGLPAAQFSLDVVPDAQPPTITSLTAGDGTVVVAFTPPTGLITPATGYQVVATDFTDPARGGQVAQGTGSPITVTGLTNGDTYTFTVTAFSPEVDLTSAPSERINVGIPASITGTPPPGEVGQPYHFTFEVAGVPTPTVVLDVGTPLPDGLTFDPATATISGTPTTAGSTFLSFAASNAVGFAQNTPTLVINPARTLLWTRVGGPYVGDPAVVSTGGPSPSRQRTDVVFAVAPSGQPVYHERAGGAWSAAKPLGGLLDSEIAPAQTLDGPEPYNFEVFGIGVDGAMWYRTRQDGWRSLGGAFHSEPTAVRFAGHSYVFAVGVDDALWYRTPTTGWASLGGIIASDLGVTSDGESLYVAGVGIDEALWTRRLTGSTWTSWESRGGAVSSTPAGTYDPVTGIGYLFSVGADGAIWYQGVTGGVWSGWYGLGGLAESDPAVVARAGGLDVYVVGADLAKWRQRWNGSTWSGWHSHGGGFTSNPAATTTHVVGLGLDDWLYSARTP